jgi:hypothetical protein
MGKVLIGLGGLVLGAILGTVFGGAILTGTTAGMGVAAGLQTGICATMQAAQDEGLLTSEQVDQVLQRAASNVAAMEGVEAEGESLGTAAACEEFLAQIQDQASE